MRIVFSADAPEAPVVLPDCLISLSQARKQVELINERVAGTGQWFLQNEGFLKWAKKDLDVDVQPTLFCPGIPGAGKTFLTSIVIDDIIRLFENDAKIGVVFFYFNSQERFSASDVFSSFLRQLLGRLPSIPRDIRAILEKNKKRQLIFSTDELIKQFRSVISKCSRTFIIMDALDECSDAFRDSLLQTIVSLQKAQQVSLYVTSRDIPDITNRFSDVRSQRVYANDDDIKAFVSAHMSALPRFIRHHQNIKEKILSKIPAKACGM